MIRPVAVLALITCTALPAHAGEADFHGKWQIRTITVGPWHDPSHPLGDTSDGPQIGNVVEIAKGSMTGPNLVGCGKTEMRTDPVPYLGMIEGGLSVETGNKPSSDEAATARRHAEALGFTAEPVEALTHSCSEIALYRADAETLVFGLDYRIFTLKKQ